VESCSDSITSDPTKKLPWQERKENYLAHLRSANDDAVLIAAADKLHNARAILSDYRVLGEELWHRFNAPKDKQFWFYYSLIATLRQTAAPKALVGELERVVKELKELAG
jgi:GTP pyrophosphokinase